MSHRLISTRPLSNAREMMLSDKGPVNIAGKIVSTWKRMESGIRVRAPALDHLKTVGKSRQGDFQRFAHGSFAAG